MIEFTDFTEHFKTPPSLYRLLGHVKDLRKGKAKVLVIVPCYGDSMRLEAFFKSMKRQEFKDFDILAVYGQHDRFVDSKGLSVIHARRKVDFGFAGAVYLGQLMAQKLGYKYFLATDVDRHPYSPKSLGILFESAIKTGAQCVFGGHLTKGAYSASEDKFIEQKNGRAAKGQTQPMSYMSSVWWLISTSYLSKTGLYLLPIYLGSDDSEFEYRLRRAGGKIVQLSVPITYGYCALKGQKYASLLQNGGLDTTYFYADIFSNTNFPHVFLPARGSLAYYMLVRAYHFLVLNMLQLRIPKLAAYKSFAQKGRYGIFRWTGTKNFLSAKPVGTDSNEYAQVKSSLKGISPYFAFNEGYGTSMLARCLFGKKTGEFYSTQLNFLKAATCDSFHVLDVKTGKLTLFVWKRKSGFARRLVALAAAGIDGAIMFAKAVFLLAAGVVSKPGFYASNVTAKFGK